MTRRWLLLLALPLSSRPWPTRGFCSRRRAACAGKLPTLELPLSRGAQRDPVDLSARTAMDYAVEAKQSEAVKRLSKP